MTIANGDADENPFDVPLVGTVTDVSATPSPEISVTVDPGGTIVTDGQAAAVEFGASLLGGPGASRTFVVRNDGTAPLQIASVTVPEGFVITEPLATALAAGGVRRVHDRPVHRDGGRSGGHRGHREQRRRREPVRVPRTAASSARPAATGAEISVLLDGSPLTTGQTVDFGNVAVGAAAPERTLTIRNDGDAALTLGQVLVPAGYTLVQGPAATTLAPDASTTLRIALNTASAGTPGGQASIANSDADENPFLLTLSGTVAAPVGAAGRHGRAT